MMPMKQACTSPDSNDEAPTYDPRQVDDPAQSV